MALTREQIDGIIDELISATNHRVYQNYPHGQAIEPHQIFLYYMNNPYELPEPKPELYIKDYGRPIRNESVVRSLVTIMANRICDPDDNFAYDSIGFDNKDWQKRTYIVIMVDSPGWVFKKKAGVVFDPRNNKKPNHTFYDGFDMAIDIETGEAGRRKASAVCFTNYMAADQFGHPLDEEEQKFKFWMFPEDPRKSRPEPIDPGGTNLGPPVPPP